MGEVTPMMRQYLEIKEQYKDAVLFFRLGDFYEMFFDDAVTGAKELELTLTGKDCGLEKRAPMCGVPFHAAESYISRLVAKGYKVAICEQMEDPATAKGLVKRDVIRIVTPGTNLDEGIVNSETTNYIASLVREGNRDAVVFADVASGELRGTVIENDEAGSFLVNELARFSPVEIALGGSGRGDKLIREYLGSRSGILTFTFDTAEISANADDVLIPQLRNASEIEDKILKCAAAAVISYIQETQRGRIPHMREIDIYKSSDILEIDLATRRNLELTETMRDRKKSGSLYGVLDKTKTSMGSRVLKSWILSPLLNPTAIKNRLDAVEELVKKRNLAEDAAQIASTMGDVERLMTRVSMKLANARDLVALRSSIEEMSAMKKLSADFESVYLCYRGARIDPLRDISDLLHAALLPEPPVSLREGGLISPGYDEEVDKLKRAAKEGSDFIASLEAEERKKTGIKNLKVGFNKVFGYYIDVSKGNVSKVPADYIRKQTLVNSERYVTLKLKEAESAVLGAQERLAEIEYERFIAVRDTVEKNMERIVTTARAVAEIDAICALAEAAVKQGYIKPTVNNGREIKIRDGRHPVVEKLTKGVFVPNDTDLDGKENIAMLITGPNMAGKSTYMRQCALIVLMAQMGSFVPASYCEIGVVDKLFTRIGASDDLARGASTFMLEMNEVSYILKNATDRSFVLFDEVGRGTSTLDGLSIAWAVMEYTVGKIGAKTMFATHYHELAALEEQMPGIKNYNTACKKRGDDITFLRKIVPGRTDDSYGIEVAKLAGVPEYVIKRAKAVLRDAESGKIEASAPGGKPERGEAAPPTDEERKVIEGLRMIDPSTLTPIEAMNKLYEICMRLRDHTEA